MRILGRSHFEQTLVQRCRVALHPVALGFELTKALESSWDGDDAYASGTGPESENPNLGRRRDHSGHTARYAASLNRSALWGVRLIDNFEEMADNSPEAPARALERAGKLTKQRQKRVQKAKARLGAQRRHGLLHLQENTQCHVHCTNMT